MLESSAAAEGGVSLAEERDLDLRRIEKMVREEGLEEEERREVQGEAKGEGFDRLGNESSIFLPFPVRKG